MSEQKEIYITSATIKRPDGTIEQLNDEEVQGLLSSDKHNLVLSNGIVSATWIEGTPEQIADFLITGLY